MDQADFLAIAKETASYVIEHERNNVLSNKNNLDLSTFSSFLDGIKGHQYYNALVLKCDGCETYILMQLNTDYREIVCRMSGDEAREFVEHFHDIVLNE